MDTLRIVEPFVSFLIDFANKGTILLMLPLFDADVETLVSGDATRRLVTDD